MTMDILFLLSPNFTDALRDEEGILYYCPDCALVEGVIGYYPQLRMELDIRYIGYRKPRMEIVDLVGATHQGCPNLILDPLNHSLVDIELFHRFENKVYTTDPKLVLWYFSRKFGIATAHF